MSKHTPGPWKLDRNSVLIPIAPYEWAEAYGGTEANARLIAAAPELLEALRVFVSCSVTVSTEIDERGHRWTEAYLDQALPIARAAIAKATEEPK